MGRSSGSSSQALLDLENGDRNPSSKESALLVCKSGDDDLLKKLEAAKTKAIAPPDTKPSIVAPPPSQVIGKLRDFLGVMAESNKKLQLDAMDKSKNYDIEALTGDESEYIEMDLMLGVADLHTPEAVTAAESAIVGSQPIISLDASTSESESESDSETEDSSDDDDDDDDDNNGANLPVKSKCDKMSEYGQKRKRPKIVELP